MFGVVNWRGAAGAGFVTRELGRAEFRAPMQSLQLSEASSDLSAELRVVLRRSDAKGKRQKETMRVRELANRYRTASGSDGIRAQLTVPPNQI